MISRRNLLVGTATLLASSALKLPAQAMETSSLLDDARALQARTYTPNTTPLAAPFAGLDYNAYRGIRPLRGHAAMLPHGPDFAIDLLPPGLFFPDPVRVDRVSAVGLRDFAFSPSLFSFEPRYFDNIPETSPGAGFSGMRLRYPLNTPYLMDEVLVVQGASYFRAIGQAMVYGLSARAVAIGTGGSTPEEFPRFTHLRLHPAEDGMVRMEGLIDSPSLAAHIEMVVQPGSDTHIDIVTTLLPRVQISDVGVAPLTSMYLKGPMRSSVSDDFRPRVHDSDVLFIENGAGEKLWRPITNPAAVETSAFADSAPSSFGLFQTARAFEDFEDTEARYHDRPSVIVQPIGDWGPGAVMLVEIPTGDEFMDNIVAFWRPDAPLEPGSEHQFAYRLSWTRAAPDTGNLATIAQTRSGREHDREGYRRFVVDFATQAQAYAPVLSASDGADISGVSAFDLPDRRGVRVTFVLAPGSLHATDIRLSLRAPDGTPLSPVWLHRWTRARDGGV